jgi:hypothetical protein
VLSRKLELLDDKKKLFSTIIPFFDYMNHVDNNRDKVNKKFCIVLSFSVFLGFQEIFPYGGVEGI